MVVSSSIDVNEAKGTNKTLIPNGDAVPHPCGGAWVAVAHTTNAGPRPGEGNQLNPFGQVIVSHT